MGRHVKENQDSRMDSDPPAIGEFRPSFTDSELDDLRNRIAATRWPSVGWEEDWESGVPVGYLRRLVDYWLGEYDWRVWEAKLASFPQYTTTIDGQLVHFLHVRSPEADAIPLILTHGWPGSVVEFLKVLGPLTDPAGHGGDPRDAFHIVAPSVPGFGFSIPLSQPGWNHMRIAQAWAELMDRLGYERYGAQGGDTGSIVSPLLGSIAPDRVIGVHINGGLAFPTGAPSDFERLTPTERSRLRAAEALRETGTGYADIQSTKPATLAYGLHDSPVGQLAWIVEKFREWTDPAVDDPADAVDIDQMLTDVTLYWLTGTAGSSARLYRETRIEPAPTCVASGVPTGVAVFPTDPAIRHRVEREHHVVHWSEFDRGGHFAAMEAPDLFIADVRTFFRGLDRDAAVAG